MCVSVKSSSSDKAIFVLKVFVFNLFVFLCVCVSFVKQHTILTPSTNHLARIPRPSLGFWFFLRRFFRLLLWFWFFHAFGDDFGIQNHLVGAGVDLDVPGFRFVQLNLYQRLPHEGDGNTTQLTAVWNYTTPVGKSAFICDGFLDWVINSDGGYSDNLHFCPQFKFDVGMLMGWDANRLNIGIEYDYWKNKYGIEGADLQHAVSAMVKSHF